MPLLYKPHSDIHVQARPGQPRHGRHADTTLPGTPRHAEQVHSRLPAVSQCVSMAGELHTVAGGRLPAAGGKATKCAA